MRFKPRSETRAPRDMRRRCASGNQCRRSQSTLRGQREFRVSVRCAAGKTIGNGAHLTRGFSAFSSASMMTGSSSLTAVARPPVSICAPDMVAATNQHCKWANLKFAQTRDAETWAHIVERGHVRPCHFAQRLCVGRVGRMAHDKLAAASVLRHCSL